MAGKEWPPCREWRTPRRSGDETVFTGASREVTEEDLADTFGESMEKW